MIDLDASITQLQNLNIIQVQEMLQPLAIYLLAITVYSIFTYKFYGFLGARDIITQKYSFQDRYSESHSFIRMIMYVMEFIILAPIIITFWAAVIILLLVILSRDPLPQIILASLALVGATRITSYYNEEVSMELAKMVPFAFLGVYLLDSSLAPWEVMLEKVSSLHGVAHNLIFYLSFVICLEIVLRLLHGIVNFVIAAKEQGRKEGGLPREL